MSPWEAVFRTQWIPDEEAWREVMKQIRGRISRRREST